MVSNNSVARSQAGSMVLEKPTPSYTNERTDGGNAQLMEASLTELYSSLRALIRSNQQLEEALRANPDDDDFIEAMEENWSVMRKKHAMAIELVNDMQRQSISIDLAEDIRDMQFPALKESTQKEHPTETEGGIYL
jgi:hypothetical protein